MCALGFPWPDPIAGLIITLVIVGIVYTTARSVFERLLDAVDPHMVLSIVAIASTVEGVADTTGVRARWVGHVLHIVMTIEVNAHLTLREAHTIAEEVRYRLFHEIRGVSEVIIHTDPASSEGEDHHQALERHLQEAWRPFALPPLMNRESGCLRRGCAMH